MTAIASDPLTLAEAARIRRDARNAVSAIRANREGRALTAAEMGGMARTYMRACNTWLYAIQAGDSGPIKIGKTVNPDDRLTTLQTANAATLRGLAAWRAIALEEQQIHEEFAHAHIRGEWFRPVPGLLELIDALGGDFAWGRP